MDQLIASKRRSMSLQAQQNDRRSLLAQHVVADAVDDPADFGNQVRADVEVAKRGREYFDNRVEVPFVESAFRHEATVCLAQRTAGIVPRAAKGAGHEILLVLEQAFAVHVGKQVGHPLVAKDVEIERPHGRSQCLFTAQALEEGVG